MAIFLCFYAQDAALFAVSSVVRNCYVKVSENLVIERRKEMRKLVLFMLLVMVCLVVVPLSGAQAANSVTIKKCKVKAGKVPGLDSISFSGILQGLTVNDLEDAAIGGHIFVTVNSADMPQPPYIATFNVPEGSVKKGKYSSPKPKIKVGKTDPKESLKIDGNKRTLKFSAKNVNLTGLNSPMSVTVEIGNYVAQVDLGETIINGKKPIPLQFMMGVKNTLRVDKVKVKFGKKGDSLSVKGAFTTVAGTSYSKNMPVVVTLGSQDWTIDGGRFSRKKYAEICKKAAATEGGSASIKIDFAKCTFVLKIQNTIISDYGQADFGIDVFGSSIVSVGVVDLGPERPKDTYSLEELRGYDRLGAYWNYSSTYSVKGSEGLSDSGVAAARVSVESRYGNINGYSCTIVHYDGEGESETDYWYTRPTGTYLGKWIGVNDLVEWEVNITSGLQVAPPELRVGQSYTATGTHTNGSMTVWHPEARISITNLSGSGKSTCKFVRHEQVRVLGTTYNAVKVEQTYVVDGSANVKIAVYGGETIYTTGTASLTIKKTWLGVPGIGIVKSQNSLSVKLSAKGEGKLSLTVKETDVLTSHN